MENGVNRNNLPTEVSLWAKIRNFLCQDITLELTPRQEKVFQEVHDFWHQEITGKNVHDFLFKEIEITGDIKF